MSMKEGEIDFCTAIFTFLLVLHMHGRGHVSNKHMWYESGLDFLLRNDLNATFSERTNKKLSKETTDYTNPNKYYRSVTNNKMEHFSLLRIIHQHFPCFRACSILIMRIEWQIKIKIIFKSLRVITCNKNSSHNHSGVLYSIVWFVVAYWTFVVIVKNICFINTIIFFMKIKLNIAKLTNNMNLCWALFQCICLRIYEYEWTHI